jgi:hypothetical protein
MNYYVVMRKYRTLYFLLETLLEVSADLLGYCAKIKNNNQVVSNLKFIIAVFFPMHPRVENLKFGQIGQLVRKFQKFENQCSMEF